MTTSVRKRFALSVGINLFRALLGFVTGMLLARWLGPSDYGNMTFLLGTFQGLGQLLDMGSSSAFFTFLSQRKRSRWCVSSYLLWLAAQFVLTLGAIGLLFPSRWIAVIWQGQSRLLVLAAFAAAFLQYSAWPVIQKIGESQRQTSRAQGLGAAIAVMHLWAVVLLWYFRTLGLYAVFIAIAAEYALAMLAARRLFHYIPSAVVEPEEPLLPKYISYCLPLVAYSGLSFAYTFADDWLLQVYGGGVQQAYYNVSVQFTSVAIILTSAVLNIFWKEIAEAHHRGDIARMETLYRRTCRPLFLVGAMIAGFFIPWRMDLIRSLLGAAYVGGATTVGIMFLYPVHQSLGQLTSTMLLATERVSLQLVVGAVFMIVSMTATYFALAPRDAVVPGLGLASEGLALKMVLMQFLQVNGMAYLIVRIWKWPFEWFFQPVSLLGCLGLGWLAHRLALGLMGDAGPLLTRLGAGALLYLLFMAVFVYVMPWLAGFTREELALYAEVNHS